MRERSSNFFITSFFSAILIVLMGLGLIGIILFRSFPPHESKTVLLPKNSSLHTVSEILRQKQIVQYPLALKLLLRLTGGSSKVRAGEFEFLSGSSLWETMSVLYQGEPIVHTITIPEGWTIRQIAEILSKEGLIDKEKFLQLALSNVSAQKFHLKTPHLEGFLFPETYSFSKVDGEERILEQMVTTFFSHYNKTLKKDAERLGFSVETLATFASIVEKETGIASERPLIASVFHNRLKKRMRLQSDPTTIYGIKNFNGNLTKADLQRYSPYNTYSIPGLPIGPIANPGLESLKATLFPATSEYLFFVSNNQGSHIFSKTYAEHSRNVNSFHPAVTKKQRQEKHPYAKHPAR